MSTYYVPDTILGALTYIISLNPYISPDGQGLNLLRNRKTLRFRN